MKPMKFIALKMNISHTTRLTLLLGVLMLSVAARPGNGDDDDDMLNENVVGIEDFVAASALGEHGIPAVAAVAIALGEGDGSVELIDNEPSVTFDNDIIAVAIASGIEMLTDTVGDIEQHAAAPTNAFDDGIVCPSAQDDNSFVEQFASPSDCSVFYKCNRGVPNLIKCPGGLHYNTEIEACDFPVRAKCQLINVI